MSPNWQTATSEESPQTSKKEGYGKLAARAGALGHPDSGANALVSAILAGASDAVTGARR